MLALVMTACGGDQSSDADEPSGAAQQAAGGACADLEGQTVTLVVPFSPGGGYDAYARMIAPYLAEELGAQVVVENQDGAGGLLAINNLLTAEPDGTRLAIMNAVGVGGGALAGAQGVQFELDELSYIGRVGASYHILSTGAGSRYQTFDDVRSARGFRFGSTGPGAADFVNASLLKEIFALDSRLVTGFEGSEENELALTRGDIDGMTGDFDSRIPAIENGDHRPLLLLGPEPDPALPDTPALLEIVDPEHEELATFQIDLLELGRPIVGPPGMPEDLLSCVRDALAAAVENPDLVAESEQEERPINWMSGEDYDQLVAGLMESPPEFVQILEQAYASG
ncbi:MAG TPA: tripartite tricarboxylate transporter substrate-binding protein [Euzebyales bacterium]|nr:tripartite tricarboxylate transporter substrate-binding protein [Euzebyales bacterium]